jgi:nitroimidazol reductase NimA-like FMN-containing flavoprotein (pyridoxamine 5'-phosphate oxidase superfamily)
MSRRHEIQFTPDEQATFLSQPHKAALATIDKEGFPHVVAMGYRYKDGVIYMTSYGKAQKVVNVRRNPKVSMMVEVGERYADFRGVMIRGYCEIIEDPQVVKETMRLAGESATAAAVPPGPQRAFQNESCSKLPRTKLPVGITPSLAANIDGCI